MNVIDRIRLIICPDPRKWSRSGPIYDARADPDNHPLIRAMIDQGFLTGDSTGPEPRIAATTWKANDLYMARLETIRKLGFIKTAAGPGGANSSALNLNPHIVLQKYREEGKIDEAHWNSLTERAVTVGAKDLFTPIVEPSAEEVTTKETTAKKRPATKTPTKKAPGR